ncbi:type II toxin-antitoxin system YoeB family toxin [Burkholderia anthina]|nr:type II toxin-antitoxin system YoeB family toxin [Burkholderia anthina]
MQEIEDRVDVELALVGGKSQRGGCGCGHVGSPVGSGWSSHDSAVRGGRQAAPDSTCTAIRNRSGRRRCGRDDHHASRRIDDTNRLVHEADDLQISIVSCRYHDA